MMGRMFLVAMCILGTNGSAGEWLIPHLTRSGGGFQSTLDVINTDFSAAHQLTLSPYLESGLPVSVPKSIEVEPGARLQLNMADLGWADIGVSHLVVDGDDGLRVAVSYRAVADEAMNASVNAMSEPITMARFTPVSAGPWFDGLAIVNPNEQGTTVLVSRHDAMGNTQETASLTVDSMAKVTAVIDALFDVAPDPSGYIEVRADSAVFLLVLRGSVPGSDAAVLTAVSPDVFQSEPAPLSYANQVSRIVQRKCETCHHAGGIGPFELSDYEDIAPLASYIHQVVDQGIMPPWRADDQCASYVGSYALDLEEKRMLLQWIDDGGELGQAEREPESVNYQDGEWLAGPPDLALSYSEPFFFPAGADVYRCYPVALNNSTEIFIKGLEIRPGNPQIVHHVLVFLEYGDDGERLDQAEEGPGYTCFGGPGTGTVRLLGGWAPGMEPLIMPNDVGMTIAPNSTIIMQVHYHYASVEGWDQTQIGLHFNQERQAKELQLLPLVNQQFVIPAGAKNFPVTASVTLPVFVPLELYSIAPHMHLLGQRISVSAQSIGGELECLVDIPRWDFNWQRFYEFESPIQIAGGTRLTLNCEFDNSADNPNNPNDPPIAVGWGEATTDEMALCFLGVVLPFQFSSAKHNQWGWEWPMKVADLAMGSPSPADRIKNLPSCCQPGDQQKPWKQCQNKVVRAQSPH